MSEVSIVADQNNVRVDVWIVDKLSDYSRSYVQKLLQDGNILVDGNMVKTGYKLSVGEVVSINIPDNKELVAKEEEIDVPILYEDDYIVVVNKPRGMVVHPACGNEEGTLVNSLLYMCKGRLSNINGVIRPGIVHRIDKDTSGVLVVAKNNLAHESLSKLLKEHNITRKYIALVEGIIHEEKGKIDAPIGRHPVDRKKMDVNLKNGKRAVTHFKVLERFKQSTLIEATLETGRTHQIRVHMKYIGHPLVGDTVYGRKNIKYEIQGQALHAKVLGFNHPESGDYMEFEAQLPEVFEDLLRFVRQSD